MIGWFQAYLGRLPTAQELAVFSNQYMLTGNALYVQSVILASNEFYSRSGNTPYGFINRLFLLTIGRTATLQELTGLQNQVIFNGRLWFVQTYLSQIAGGWQYNNWNTGRRDRAVSCSSPDFDCGNTPLRGDRGERFHYK